MLTLDAVVDNINNANAKSKQLQRIVFQPAYVKAATNGQKSFFPLPEVWVA